MKFLIKFVMVIGILVLGGAWIYGRGLPREHVASASIVLVAPADTVFKLVRNLEGSASWWRDVKGVRRITEHRREAWELDMGSMGKMPLEVTRVVQGREVVVTVIGDEDAAWGGIWRYVVNDSPSGTEVTVTEEGWVASPLIRLVQKVVGPHRAIERYLRALGDHFGEPVTPRRG